MTPSRHLKVSIDLKRIRENVKAIAVKTGVPIIAVVKADGYGVGATEVVRHIHDLVDGFYFFSLDEVIQIRAHKLSQKQSVVLTGPDSPEDYRNYRATPVVWSTEQAALLKSANPILSIETGQGRFACPPEEIAPALAAGNIRETMTHATRFEQIDIFLTLLNALPGGADRYFKHVAGSGLLDEPRAWMQSVRPGLAMYESAVRVSARLQQVTTARGPVGYQRHAVDRYGIIFAGYSNGVRMGPCRVNEKPGRIFEVGMQSSFVEVGADVKNGDEVVLLGDGLTAADVAKAWCTTPQESLLRLASSGVREYSVD